MKIIRQRYTILAPQEKVWDALVNPETIKRWGGGPVMMSDKAGFEFSLWGGDVYGKNLEVEIGKRLVQEWYGGEWEYPSIVTFSLSNDGHCTEVILEHRDVPENEIKDINEGWRDYYLGPIKDMLEGKSSE